jgi:hypothetical protein
MVVFAGITLRILLQRSAAFDDRAALPLDDGEVRRDDER